MLANPRIMHAQVAACIPGAPDTERVLWRLDADNAHRPMLFVLTRSRPDWSHLIEAAGWPYADGEHATVREYAPLLKRLAVGKEFAFRLTASPVQNAKRPEKATKAQNEKITDGRHRGFRIGHRTASAQLGWLISRTARLGFEIPSARTDPAIADITDDAAVPALDVRLIARQRRSFPKSSQRHHVVIHTASFEGRLRVTDPVLLERALLEGIGPSKAYGCGLLTLAPLPGGH